MPVPRAENMITMLKTNASVIKMQLDDLTDAHLLLQPDMRGNCANWVLGHIVDNRSSIIYRMTGEYFWSDNDRALYKFDSDPITSTDDPHLSMERLLADYEATGKIILDLLENITDARLDEMFNERSTLNQSVHWLIWHESYHMGQFEYLRQLTGVNDKVI